METDDVAACFEGPILRVYVATDTNDLVNQVDQACCTNDLILQVDATTDTIGLILTKELCTSTKVRPDQQNRMQAKGLDCVGAKQGEARPKDTTDQGCEAEKGTNFVD